MRQCSASGSVPAFKTFWQAVGSSPSSISYIFCKKYLKFLKSLAAAFWWTLWNYLPWPSFSVGSGSVMTLKAGSGSGQNHSGSTTMPTGSEVSIKAPLITNLILQHIEKYGKQTDQLETGFYMTQEGIFYVKKIATQWNTDTNHWRFFLLCWLFNFLWWGEPRQHRLVLFEKNVSAVPGQFLRLLAAAPETYPGLGVPLRVLSHVVQPHQGMKVQLQESGRTKIKIKLT